MGNFKLKKTSETPENARTKYCSSTDRPLTLNDFEG